MKLGLIYRLHCFNFDTDVLFFNVKYKQRESAYSMKTRLAGLSFLISGPKFRHSAQFSMHILQFAEHLRSVRNNDVDKPVARHFNAANHSISDIKICAISPISGGNDSRKRHEKRLIFKIETIHPHALNERFSFI